MESQLQLIAARLRDMRDIRNITVEDMARQLNLSLEEYLHFELGDSDIPVSTLHEAAQILGVDLTELLTGKEPKLRSYCLVKKGKGIQVDRYKGYDFQSLAYNFIHRSAEPLLVTVPAEDDTSRPMELVTHPGQEFNYVLEGTIHVYIGDTMLTLTPGDSVYFDPTVPHGQRAVDGPGKFLTVIL